MQGATMLIHLLVLTFVCIVHGSPMIYKKNDNDKYEPDLVAVSSTVIPLTVYEASVALGGGAITPLPSLSDEYKLAYIKHLHKKVASKTPAGAHNAGKLITIKTNGSLASVRSV